jgi:hypothetical protein
MLATTCLRKLHFSGGHFLTPKAGRVIMVAIAAIEHQYLSVVAVVVAMAIKPSYNTCTHPTMMVAIFFPDNWNMSLLHVIAKSRYSWIDLLCPLSCHCHLGVPSCRPKSPCQPLMPIMT